MQPIVTLIFQETDSGIKSYPYNTKYLRANLRQNTVILNSPYYLIYWGFKFLSSFAFNGDT